MILIPGFGYIFNIASLTCLSITISQKYAKPMTNDLSLYFFKRGWYIKNAGAKLTRNPPAIYGKIKCKRYCHINHKVPLNP